MTSSPRPLLDRPGAVAAAYTVLTIAFTWPVTAGIARDVPGDLGDSLLNMWILGWGADHLPALVTGHLGWAAFWHGNIFHPEPYTLALSEHMFAQSLQIWPLVAATDNLILAYNVVFLSTFVLSALGAYLLARDLTGDWRAAFVAGLVYGFLPFRISQVPHVQIMSSQWMPFALAGFHRFIARRSTPALAWGTGALVLQNWSCGYYLLYFAPIVPLFVAHTLWQHDRLRDFRAWLAFAAAGGVTLALSLPFLLPYTEAQRIFGFERPYGEVVGFSANVWSYLTAAEPIHLWGRLLRFYPHGEGETFLGVSAALLGLVGLGGLAAAARPRPGEAAPAGWRRTAATIMVIAVIAQAIGFLSTVLVGGFNVKIAGLNIRATTPVRLLVQLGLALAAWLALSPRARAAAGRVVRSPILLAGALMVLAAWLSLGPLPSAGGARVSGMGLYGVLYDHVPGFTGVRVPARYAMIAGLFLAVLAGYGVQALGRRPWGARVIVAAGLLVVADGAAMPFEVNRTWGQNQVTPPRRIYPAAEAPAVYQRVRALPEGTVIAEFPFGDAAWEMRYVYYAGVHRKPIVNGYSGSFPPGYKVRMARIARIDVDPGNAWQALVDAGVTHIVVHVPAFTNPNEPRWFMAWLESRGAHLLQSFPDGDALYTIR